MALKKVGKRQAVKDGIVEMIRGEGLRPGDQILSQNQLALHFGVNPLTVIKALGDLCAENILYRENGRGTFVGPSTPTEKMRRIGLALPEKNLHLQANNPESWLHLQQWFKSFMECMGENMTFGSAVIPYNDISGMTLEKTGEFDMLFLLSLKGYDDLIKKMLDKGATCPVVLDDLHDELNCLYLTLDRRASVRKGISHMLRLGYRKIAFLSSGESYFESGVESYKETLSKAGIDIGGDSVFRGSGDLNAALELLVKDNRFEAVFTVSTRVGMLALDFFQRNGVRVPENIGVMSDEGLETFVAAPPYLTSVLSPHKQIINFALSFTEANQYKYKSAYGQLFTGDVYPGRTCVQQQS